MQTVRPHPDFLNQKLPGPNNLCVLGDSDACSRYSIPVAASQSRCCSHWSHCFGGTEDFLGYPHVNSSAQTSVKSGKSNFLACSLTLGSLMHDTHGFRFGNLQFFYHLWDILQSTLL